MPHLKARGVRLPLSIPGLPDGQPQVDSGNAGFRMLQEGPPVDLPRPRLGEHTQEILAWFHDAG